MLIVSPNVFFWITSFKKNWNVNISVFSVFACWTSSVGFDTTLCLDLPFPEYRLEEESGIPVNLIRSFVNKKVKRSVDVFVNEACQSSQKFLQLFSAFYTLIIITINVDDYKEETLCTVHEYLSKLKYFCDKFYKRPLYFVLFTTEDQEKGPSDAVEKVKQDVNHVLTMMDKEEYVSFFIINTFLDSDTSE